MVRPFVKRKIAVFAALALCAFAHGQTSASNSTPVAATNENTLESARRELKDLPTAERSRDVLGKSTTLGPASLPMLALPGDTGNATAARPDPNQPPSATWLQDALNQTDAESAAHRRASDSSLSRERDQSSGYKSAEIPNPFGQYLEQWISPHDLELLRAGQDTKKSSESGQAVTKSWEPLKAPSSSSGLTPDGAGSQLSDTAEQSFIPSLSAARNPYIEEPDLAPPASNPSAISSQAAPGQSQPDRTRVPPPLASIPAATPQGTSQPTPLKPVAAPTEPASPPPTAPIVDDRKYFPQLRRF